MKAKLIKYRKAIDELGNAIEVKMWELPEPSEDKPHRYKYSLAYIINGERVIGYDNAEGKGDHRHHRNLIKPYNFVSLRQLAEDFYKDIERYKRGEL